MQSFMNRIIPDEKSKMALLSIISNTLLVVIKIIAGILTGAVSIISEGIHSALDLLAAIIAYISVRVSRRPPDETHKYGHGKVENVSGTIEAVLIFIAAVWIMVEAYDKLINKTPVETLTVGVVVMGISVAANTLISMALMKTAKKTDSVALEADAMHLRTDVYTSLGVLGGLVIIQLTGLTILDPIIAIGVACLIIKAAYELTIKAFRPLLDASLSKGEEEIIVSILDSFNLDQVVGYHKLRTRRSGADRYMDLHLVVDRDISIDRAHYLAHMLENEIKQKINRANVLIHIEPCKEAYCEQCQGCIRLQKRIKSET